MKDRRSIAYNYAFSWLIIDVVAVLPYELMTPKNDAQYASLAKARILAATCLPLLPGRRMFSRYLCCWQGLRLAKFTRILRVLRVVKLLRILKVPALLKRIESSTGRNGIRSIVVVGAAILITHLAACGFYYTAEIGKEDKLLNDVRAAHLTYAEYKNLSEADQNVFLDAAWEKTWVGTSGLTNSSNVERYRLLELHSLSSD